MMNKQTEAPFEADIMNQDRVWSISRAEVEALRIDAADGLVSSDLSEDILSWPARSNPFYNGLFDDRDGAPFFDNNSDGKYNVYDGDYPTIGDGLKTTVPDQILLSVTNDSNSNKFNGLGLEVYTFLYAFYCDESEQISNSVFTKYLIYNRSNLDYSNVRVGHYFDTDLGCGQDDYVGCDSLNNVFYIYNMDNVDGDAGDACTSGAKSFEKTPVHIVKVLDGDLSSFIYYGRADLVPNILPDVGSALSNEDNIYALCSGRWPDDNPITSSGSGYNLNASNTTSYAFHGNPNQTESWAMNNINFPNIDPRVLAGQHVDMLKSGEKLQLELVHTYVQSDSHDHIESVDLAIEHANTVQMIYDNNFESQCTQSEDCQGLGCVAPGDVNNNEIVERTDAMLLSTAVSKSNTFENPRNFISNDWKLYEESLRSEYFANGVNYIHSDCNGDGEINAQDYAAFSQHYTKTTTYFEEYTEQCDVFEGSGTLKFNNIPNAVLSTSDMVVTNGSISIESFENVSSVSFRLQYDSQLIDSIGSLEEIIVGFNGDNISESILIKENTGQELVIVNYELSGSDTEATLINLLFRFSGESLVNTTAFTIADILIMDADEHFYCMDDIVYDVIFSDLTSTEEIADYSLTIAPNPTVGLITLKSDVKLNNYRLFSIDGNIVKQGQVSASNTIDLAELNHGIYLLELEMPNQKVHQERLIVVD